MLIRKKNVKASLEHETLNLHITLLITKLGFKKNKDIKCETASSRREERRVEKKKHTCEEIETGTSKQEKI